MDQQWSLNDFPDDSQEQDSINSQELLDQIERKINIEQNVQQEEDSHRDQYENDEMLSYTKFKEQTIVKRLLDLKQEHQDFIKSLPKHQEALVIAIKEFINRIRQFSQTQLKDTERSLQEQLKLLQTSIVKRAYDMSPMKAKETPCLQLENQVKKLQHTIDTWPFHDISMKSGSKHKSLQKGIISPIKLNTQIGGLNKASVFKPSPFKLSSPPKQDTQKPLMTLWDMIQSSQSRYVVKDRQNYQIQQIQSTIKKKSIQRKQESAIKYANPVIDALARQSKEFLSVKFK